MAESLFKTKPWSFLLRAQRLMANKINTIVLQNLLAPFCFVLEKTLYGTFLCLAVSASSCKFNKKKNKQKIKNYNLTEVYWHLWKQVGVIA